MERTKYPKQKPVVVERTTRQKKAIPNTVTIPTITRTKRAPMPTMERTTRTKRDTTVIPEEKIDKTIFIIKAGGFMPFPPDHCIRKQTKVFGIPCIDLCICVKYCQGNYCSRRNEYMTLLKENRGK